MRKDKEAFLEAYDLYWHLYRSYLTLEQFGVSRGWDAARIEKLRQRLEREGIL